MDVKTEVAIVSVFGRGHWLAASLAQHKVPVALLDISAQMGQWMAEDIEGPFGHFSLSESEMERLQAEVSSTPVANGFTFWLADGPLELLGPTASHRLKQYGIDESVFKYLKDEAKLEAFRNQPFPAIWPAHVAHSFSSTINTMASEADREGLKRNLLSPFYIRQKDSKSHDRSLAWCEQKGVKVLKNVELVDLSFEEGQLTDLEIRTDKPGLFKADQFVFCLTAEECSMLGLKIQNSLFPKGVVEPEWAWLRYRIRIQGHGPLSNLSRDQIPLHSLVIEDLMLPWTHENFMVLQRTLQKDEFDVWMKLPNNQRFHSQYLMERGRKMKALLEGKIPDNDVEILKYPVEANSTFQKVGPARHPIYSRSIRAQRKTHQQGNIFFDSPEYWLSLSWEGQFEHQKKMDRVLKAAWDRKEELRLKREAKEAAKRKKQNKDSGAEL